MGDTESPQSDESRQFETYKLMVETWKWQISSNWHRTDYFAAFQTALLLAAGKVMLDKHLCTAIALCAFGFVLNVIWILNDLKTGAYTNYWRKAAGSVEGRTGLPEQFQFISESEYEIKAAAWGVRRTYPKYEHLMWCVRLLFAAGWLALAVAAIAKACYH